MRGELGVRPAQAVAVAPAQSVQESTALLRAKQIGLCCAVLFMLWAAFEFDLKSSSSFDLVQDPVTGIIRYRPHTVIQWGREGHGRTTIGEHGMIVDKAVPGGVPRVMFIGNSFTEALQVDDAAKYTELVEASARQSGVHFTSVNMAMAGLSPVQAVADLQALVALYKPDVVVLQAAADAFVASSLVPRGPVNSAGLRTRADGELEIVRTDARRPPSAARDLLIRYRLFSAAARVQSTVSSMIEQESGMTVASAATLADAPAGALRAAAEDGGGDAYRARVRFLVEQATAHSRAAGARTIVLSIPAVPRIRDGHRYLTVSDVQYGPEHQQALTAACAQAGVELVDPTPAFVSYFTATRHYPFGFHNSSPGDGHLNGAGHRLIAQDLLPAIVRALGSNVSAHAVQ